jgi:hypothetical protein
MDDALFANMYIERILAEVTELTKIKMMNETRILYLERQVNDLDIKINTLTHQAEKKKAPKLREVVDNSGEF